MLKIFTTVSFLLFSSFSYAAIISGNLTTTGGKSVELSGLEWLSFDHTGFSTLGVSTATISDSNSKWSIDGWRYASFEELTALNSSLGLIRANSIDNEDGVSFILDRWDSYTQPELARDISWVDPSYHQVQTSFDRLYGATGDYDSNGDLIGTGWLQYVSSSDITKTYDDSTLDSHNTTYSSYYIWESSSLDPSRGPTYGSYLVREASVPEPSVIALFTAGLFGIGFARRRKV